jgi:hypothetical protein
VKGLYPRIGPARSFMKNSTYRRASASRSHARSYRASGPWFFEEKTTLWRWSRETF